MLIIYNVESWLLSGVCILNTSNDRLSCNLSCYTLSFAHFSPTKSALSFVLFHPHNTIVSLAFYVPVTLGFTGLHEWVMLSLTLQIFYVLVSAIIPKIHWNTGSPHLLFRCYHNSLLAAIRKSKLRVVRRWLVRFGVIITRDWSQRVTHFSYKIL